MYNTCTYTSNYNLDTNWAVSVDFQIFDQSGSILPFAFSGDQQSVWYSLSSIPSYGWITYESGSLIQIRGTPYMFVSWSVDYWTGWVDLITFSQTNCYSAELPTTLQTTTSQDPEIISKENLEQVALVELWISYLIIIFLLLKKIWKIF